MWLILEECGVACAIITYVVVVTVYLGFIRVGIWEEAMKGDLFALTHFFIFQYNCFMIFLSHFKCMTTEPGLLPKETEMLEFHQLPDRTRAILVYISKRMKNLESDMRLEYDQAKRFEKAYKDSDGWTSDVEAAWGYWYGEIKYVLTGVSDNVTFIKEKHDIVRASWCTVIQRISFEQFGKDIFGALIAQDKSILPKFEFAKEDLNTSQNYRRFLLNSVDQLNSLVTEFHNDEKIAVALDKLK